MAATALNPALNIPSGGPERFAAAPAAVGGPTRMSGRRAGPLEHGAGRRSRTASGTRAPPRRSTGARLLGIRRFGRAPARGPQRPARTAREPARARRRNITSFPRRGRDALAQRRLGDLGNGVLGRFPAMKTARGTVNLLPPVRLLWVELRQAGEQSPGLDCKKPYRGKNSPGVTVCHDPLLGPAARDTADRLFLWGHPPPTSRGRPASAIAPPGVRLDKKLSSTGSSMTAVHSRIVSQRWCAPLKPKLPLVG